VADRGGADSGFVVDELVDHSAGADSQRSQAVAVTRKGDLARVELDRDRDRRARREAVRGNAEKGVGRNLEEAIHLLCAADEFRDAFSARR
jgi:hypothetical protein